LIWKGAWFKNIAFVIVIAFWCCTLLCFTSQSNRPLVVIVYNNNGLRQSALFHWALKNNKYTDLKLYWSDFDLLISMIPNDDDNDDADYYFSVTSPTPIQAVILYSRLIDSNMASKYNLFWIKAKCVSREQRKFLQKHGLVLTLCVVLNFDFSFQT
jgi:hypothetical protein